jgi:hypothetical protein
MLSVSPSMVIYFYEYIRAEFRLNVVAMTALLEIRVLQGFFTSTNPCPKGFSRCEKPLKVF